MSAFLGITLNTIWQCEDLDAFRRLLKGRYYRVAKIYHPDPKDAKPGQKAFRRFTKIATLYHKARKLNNADFLAYQALRTVPDVELPFAFSWDREVRLPFGYHEVNDQRKYG